jgi:hypothetical protein
MKHRALVLALGLLLLVAPALRIVAAPPEGPAAQVSGQINSPRDQASVRGLVPVEGIATHGQFQKYELHFGPEPNPGDQWTPVSGSPFTVPVVQGRIALWDTTIIPDGVYSLRLRVVRADGNYDEYFVRGIQVNNTTPTETPTPQAIPTASGPTDTPEPTLTVQIAVPTVSSPTPRPSSTPLPTGLPTVTSEPLDLPWQNVGDAACWGVGATAALFVGLGLFFAIKAGLASLARWIAERREAARGG